MFRDLLGPIDGISGYRIMAMLIFFTVFVGVVIRVLRMDRKEIEHMKFLPIEAESQPSTEPKGDTSRGAA